MLYAKKSLKRIALIFFIIDLMFKKIPHPLNILFLRGESWLMSDIIKRLIFNTIDDKIKYKFDHFSMTLLSDYLKMLIKQVGQLLVWKIKRKWSIFIIHKTHQKCQENSMLRSLSRKNLTINCKHSFQQTNGSHACFIIWV